MNGESVHNVSKQSFWGGLVFNSLQCSLSIETPRASLWDSSRTNRWGIIHTKGKGWYVTLPSENEDMELHNSELQPARDVSRTFKSQVVRRRRLRGKTPLLMVRILFLWKTWKDFLQRGRTQPNRDFDTLEMGNIRISPSPVSPQNVRRPAAQPSSSRRSGTKTKEHLFFFLKHL